MAKVRLVQDMSGPRPDGRAWPAAGSVMEVSDAEAADLTALGPEHGACAVRVAEPRHEQHEQEAPQHAEPKPEPPEEAEQPRAVRPRAAARGHGGAGA